MNYFHSQLPMQSQNPVCSAIPKNRRQPGFTLVELLIVIVIVAVLALLVFGMSSKMLQKAKKTASINSMRQVALATTVYTSENNGDLLRVIYPSDTKLLSGGLGWHSNQFWGRLQPILFPDLNPTDQTELAKNLKERLLITLNTKDITTMRGTPFFGSKIYPYATGLTLPFGFNNKLYKWDEFKKIHSFDNEARIVYFTYGFASFDEDDGKKFVEPPITAPASQSNIYWFSDKTAAFTFLDGHVEVLKPPLAKERFE